MGLHKRCCISSNQKVIALFLLYWICGLVLRTVSQNKMYIFTLELTYWFLFNVYKQALKLPINKLASIFHIKSCKYIHIFSSCACPVLLSFQVMLRLNNTNPWLVNILHLISFTQQQISVIMFIKIQTVLIPCWKLWEIWCGKILPWQKCPVRSFEVGVEAQVFPILLIFFAPDRNKPCMAVEAQK